MLSLPRCSHTGAQPVVRDTELLHENAGAVNAANRSAQPCKVLCLDDSLFDRTKLRRLCAELDMLVLLDEAETVQDFEIQLSGGPYDLYILDCRLPVDSGFAALDMLRKRGLGDTSNVVMISGMDIPEFASAARLAGCKRFIEKPDLTKQSLRRLLEEVRNAAQHLRRPRQPVKPQHKSHHVPFAQTPVGKQRNKLAMGADGMVLRCDDDDRLVATEDPQDLLDLAMQLLDADEFIFNA